MDIKSLLRLRPKGDSSEALKEALAGAEAKRAEIAARIASLQERREGVLLDGELAEVEALEGDLAAARSEAERVSLIIAALPARIEAAEKREDDRRLDRVRDETDRISAEAAALVPKIMKASEELAALVDHHDAVVHRVQQANQVLKAGGRDRVPLPTQRVWQHNPSGVIVSRFGPGLALPTPLGARGVGAAETNVSLAESIQSASARVARMQMPAE